MIVEPTHSSELDHLDIASGSLVTLKAFAADSKLDAPPSDRPKGKLIVRGEVCLDPFGDGSYLLKRPIEEESFRLSFF